MNEVDRHPDRLILFIDELHTLTGAGSAGGGGEGGGAGDAANMLKPALAKGLRCMGATTLTEFRKFLEPDPALTRRFQQVRVEELTPSQTLHVLRAVKSRYEQYHNLTYAESALTAAVRLAERFLPSVRFPDKALDLLDDAAALSRLTGTSDGSGQGKGKVVQEEDVVTVLATRTGLPPSLIAPALSGAALAGPDLLDLEKALSRLVKGQEKVIRALCANLRVARAGLCRPDRPMGVFLLMGGSGVGKTQLVKSISRLLFPVGESEAAEEAATGNVNVNGSGSEKGALLRIDMSEYSEAFTASRLLGAPPGYVGYSSGAGLLTESVRQRPHQVILLDEFEKAHPDLANLFLQVFDEGRLTDAHGRVVDFRHTLIFLTCNLSAETRERLSGMRREGRKEGEGKRLAAAVLTAELASRLDEALVFQPLDRVALEEICLEQLRLQVQEPLWTQRQVRVTFGGGLVEELVRAAEESGGGARPLGNAVQSRVLPLCASLLLEVSVHPFQPSPFPLHSSIHIIRAPCRAATGCVSPPEKRRMEKGRRSRRG